MIVEDQKSPETSPPLSFFGKAGNVASFLGVVFGCLCYECLIPGEEKTGSNKTICQLTSQDACEIRCKTKIFR